MGVRVDGLLSREPYIIYAMSTSLCERDSSLIYCKLDKENQVNIEMVRMNKQWSSFDDI